MEFIATALPEVILIKPYVIEDDRGFFMESYKRSEFIKNGIVDEFIQDNHSYSNYGVLRGLHYQLNPQPQAKLIRCTSGCVFDVAVDIRVNSPNFGKWVAYELSASNKWLLYIPGCFAHGFVTLSPNAELNYKVTHEYAKDCERGIKFDDKTLNITWPKLDINYILSQKDAQQPSLNEAEINFYYK